MSRPDSDAEALKATSDSVDDPIEEQLASGAQFAGTPNVPSSVVAGGTIDISGEVYLDCASCVTPRAVRVLVQSPEIGERVINMGQMEDGPIGSPSPETFATSLAAPQEPDQTVHLTLYAQTKSPVTGDWDSEDKTRVYNINVNTQSEERLQNAVSWAPYVAGGGGAAALSQLGESPSRVATAGVAGAAVGAGAKALVDNASFRFQFPTVPIAATAGLLFAGGLFLNQVGGVDLGLDDNVGGRLRGGARRVRRRLPTGSS